MEDRTGRLEALLTEAEAAHGVYESTELSGVYDAEWPRWYAQYLVDHGIGELLGRDLAPDELGSRMTAAWSAYESADPKPAEPWTTFIARRVAEDFSTEAF